MAPLEKIRAQVALLPEELQVEVLEFVERLLARDSDGHAYREDAEWLSESVGYVFREVESESEPEYTVQDIKVPFA